MQANSRWLKAGDASCPCIAVGQSGAAAECAHPPRAAAGDQVSHLRWRIMHGEIFQKQPPAVIVVHIGTNDLGEAANLHPVCLWELLSACWPALPRLGMLQTSW